MKFSRYFAILVAMSSCTSGGSGGGNSQGGSGEEGQGGEGGDNSSAGGSGGSGGANLGTGGTLNSGGSIGTGGGSGGMVSAGGSGGSLGTGGAGGTRMGGMTAAGGAGGSNVSMGGAGAIAGTGNVSVYTGWPYNAAEAVRRQNETAVALGLTAEVNVDLGGGVMMPMMVVPAGASILGSAPGTPDAEGDERLRQYTQPRPFLIGKTEFTRAQYNAVVGSFPVQPAPAHARVLTMTNSLNEPALAVYTVMRDTVLAAVRTRAPNGWTFRLPSLDEWEYAARAGAGTVWTSGDDPASLGTIAWYKGNSGFTLHDVGLKLPNAWNLYVTIGNAWEFTFRAGTGYGDADPTYHFIRGGESGADAFGNGCRTSNLGITDTGVGYRFVADVPMP